jgi:hypothetical protein
MKKVFKHVVGLVGIAFFLVYGGIGGTVLLVKNIIKGE